MRSLPPLLVALALTGCPELNIEKVPAAPGMSAEAARTLIDSVAAVPPPKKCDALIDKLKEQAARFVDDPQSAKGDEALFSDGLTRVSLVKGAVVDGVRKVTIKIGRVDEDGDKVSFDEVPVGDFSGSFTIRCTVEEVQEDLDAAISDDVTSD
jgi:hypothetical protein